MPDFNMVYLVYFKNNLCEVGCLYENYLQQKYVKLSIKVAFKSVKKNVKFIKVNKWHTIFSRTYYNIVMIMN